MSDTNFVPEVPAEIPLPFDVALKGNVKIDASIYEYWMNRLDGNAFKVFCWVLYETQRQLKKKSASLLTEGIPITVDAFMQHTGISNRLVTLNAIRECLDVGGIQEIPKRTLSGARRYIPRHERGSYRKGITGYIYVIKSGSAYKIGKALSLKKRALRYITETPDEIELVCSALVSDYTRVEQELHTQFADKRQRGEWFLLDLDDVHHIKSYLAPLSVGEQAS